MAGPLEGIRVVDLSNVISGPMATALLADQGAEVIKVETLRGDMTRGLGPAKEDRSAMFITANRGKRSIALDLKQQAARDILAGLIDRADVLVENFRPGAMARLGFDHSVCAARNPRLVYCSITGFGQDGPMAGMRVYDPVIQAASGVAGSLLDPVTRAPMLFQGLICDKLTALTAAQAITAALLARERAGPDAHGQKLEIAMLDCAIAFLWPDAMYNYTYLDDPPPKSPEFGAFYRLWPTQDGHVALAAVQDDEFRAVCTALGLDDLADDPRFATAAGRMQNAGPMLQAMGAAMASRTGDEVTAAFLEHGAPGYRVNDRAGVIADPQVVHNKAVIAFDNGSVGRVRGPRHPTRFSGTPTRPVPKPAPALGADSMAILAELGWSAQAVSAATASGAVKG